MDNKQIASQMLDIIKRYSKKLGVDKKDVQVILHFKEDSTIGFKFCVNFKPVINDEKIEDVLNIKKNILTGKYIDIFNLCQTVPLHIVCSLVLTGKRLEIQPNKLNAIVCHNKKEGKDENVRLLIYKETSFIEESSLSAMFDNSNIEKFMELQEEELRKQKEIG